MNFRSLPLSVPIHFDWDGKPNFFVPRMMIWVLAGISTFIYLQIFYLTKNINSPMLKMPQNSTADTMKAELIVSVFHLVIMLILTYITYKSIAVSLGKYEVGSPVNNYLIVALFLGVIVMMIYSYIISKRPVSQNSTA